MHAAAGRDYSLALNYSTELSGSVAVGNGPTAPLSPSGNFLRSFIGQRVSLSCLPRGGGCGGGGGGGGGGGAPCALGRGGGVTIADYNVGQHVRVFNYDVEQSQQQPANAQNAEPSFYVPLPQDEAGNPARSGFVPMQLTSRITVSGSGSCVGSGAGFGVAAPVGTLLRLPQSSGNLLDFSSHRLVIHRRGSPLGAGWALTQASTVYRASDELGAEIVHGSGEQESFHPYPQLQQIADFQNGSANSFAVDAQTGEIFAARYAAGVLRVDPQSSKVTTVFGGDLFGGETPADFKVTYVANARRFLAATTDGFYEVGANGTSRLLAAIPNGASAPPVIAGVGKYAYFAVGQKIAGASVVSIPTISRVDLTDPDRKVVDITPKTGGDLRLDPHGEVAADAFQFAHPAGLSAAFDGGLYVADNDRNAVYHLAPDDSGEVGPSSRVTRVLGSGADTMVGRPGTKFPALEVSLRTPARLAVSPTGLLYVSTTFGGLLVFDPAEKTARWVAFDKSNVTSATDPVNTLSAFSLKEGSLAPLGVDDVVVPLGGLALRLTTKLSSQYDPLRTLSFGDSGVTVVDTGSDTIEEYTWSIGKTEGLLTSEKRRSGELIRSMTYKDADRLDYIQDAAGGHIQFAYDGGGHLASVTDAAQRTTRFNVDSTGNLREIVYPSGEARRFDYDNFRMTSATHPNGEASTYSYAPDGTLQTAKRPGGGTTTIASGYSRGPRFDSTGRVYYESLITDDRGVQHALSTDAAGAVIEDKYTADGQAYDVKNVYATVLGRVYSFATSSTNRLLRFSHTTINGLPVGPYTSFDLLGRATSVAQSPFDPTFKWGATFDNNQRVSRLGFGSGGIDQALTFDAAGHVTKVADVSNGNGDIFPETGHRTTYAGFRPDGQATTVTSHGIPTTLGYDALGLVNSAVDSVGRSSSASHDTAGNALSIGDGATALKYAYDLGGRVTTVTDAENNSTSFSYQSAGCSCSNGDRVTSITTPDLLAGQKWAMSYDADGELQSTTSPLGEVETYMHDAHRDLVAVTDRANRSTTFTYDQLGRQTTITDPLGRVGVFSYSSPTAASWVGPTLYAQSQTSTPAPVSLTAALADGQYQVGTNGIRSGANRSHVSLYRDTTYQSSQWLAMDALDRVQTHEDRSKLGVAFDSTVAGPLNAQPGPFTDEYRGYVGSGSALTNVETNDAYTASRYWGVSLTRNADYDLTRFDAGFLGQTPALASNDFPMVVSRDVAGRLTGVSVGEGAGVLGASGIGYKPNGKLDFVNVVTATSKPAYIGDACFDTECSSTPEGCMPCTLPKGCGVSSKSCFFRSCLVLPGAGQGRCLAYTSATQVAAEKFDYDDRGLVSTRTLPVTPGVAQYSYDQVGRNVLLVYPDGHRRTQVFDALGRLTSRCYSYADGSAEHCYSATCDAVGNPKVLTDPGMRQEIAYDDLDRVTEVRRFVPSNATVPTYTESYAYNALGGFSTYDGIAVDHQRPRLDGAGKASAGIPASFAGQPVALDGGGRVTSFNGQTLQYYNFQHALQTLSTATTKQAFTYDSLQRLSNVHIGPLNDALPNDDFSYIYSDLSGSIAAGVRSPHTGAVYPGPSDLPSTTFNIGYDALDEPLWIDTQGTFSYVEIDAIGNVRRLHTDSVEAEKRGGVSREVASYSYSAFGKLLGASDPGGSSSQPPLFGWQGKRLIAKNLYDSRARVWSADLGAFLQPDEYGYLTRGGTLWSWPGQNPYRWRDPSGRDFESWILHQSWADDLAPALAELGLASDIPPLMAVGEAALLAIEGINLMASVEAQRQSAAAIAASANAQKECTDPAEKNGWKPGPNDVDWRGSGKSMKDALDEAFGQTGVPREDFDVTQWGHDAAGKSFPTEWRAPGGAEVNVDVGHEAYGPGTPHVGWQTPGSRSSGGAKRGHILVDDVPYNR